MIARVFGLIILTICAAESTAAQNLSLSQPIDCTLGKNCYIQQYVDRQPGKGARDFRCGSLSYDEHKGTDFALPSHADAARGVNVLAAAPGRVVSLRDGMADRLYSQGNAETVTGKECGNGVRIDHGNGWETQYCHLRRGSILVRRGQSVKRGQVLGQVGLSGRTQFPHLHLTVRRDGEVVDPFAPDSGDACVTSPVKSLWRDTPPYRPGGLVSLGFATSVPKYEAIKAGRAALPKLAADAPALVFWAYAYGGRAGDELHLRIDGPEGEVIDHSARLEKTQAQLFRAAGVKRPRAGWAVGHYRGVARLVRDGRVIDQQSGAIAIR